MFQKGKKIEEIAKPAIFLDRDGVLCEERGYLHEYSEMKIFPYSKFCIQQFHDKGYLAIVVSNQGGIAKGCFDLNELLLMNDALKNYTLVDEVYFCPHHPDGVIPEYHVLCSCRKPELGMVKKACQDFNIDMKSSYMVGDRASDILLGKKAGIKTILLESGYGTGRLEEPVKPDYIFHDLRDVVKLLERDHK